MHILGKLQLGGSEKLVSFIVEGLDQDQFEVSVCCIGELGHYGEELRDQGYMVYSLDVDGKWWKIFQNLNAFLKLVRLLKSHKIDIVNAHLFISGTVGRIAGILGRVPALVHTTHNIMYPKIEPLVNKLLEPFTKAVVVDSEAVKKKLITAGQSPEKIHVIYNGIDTVNLSVKSSPSKIRNELGFNKDDIILGTISHLERYKGHDFLIESFARLAPKYPNIYLILIGDGSLRETYEESISRFNLQNRIRLLGKRPDLLDLLSTIDIMVHPSRWEGFGIILAEAMYCRIPIVSTDRGGIPEVVSHNECGFIAPFGDVEIFSEYISRLITSKSLREKFGESGHKLACEKFPMSQMINSYSELYHSVIR